MIFIFFFFIFSNLAIFFGLSLAFFQNPMYSILSLVSCVFFRTLLLFLFGIEFMSFVYLVVYIGAIATLFLFMVMMLNANSINSIQHHISILDIFLYVCIFIKTLYISFFVNTNLFNFYLDNLKSKPATPDLIGMSLNTKQFNEELYEFYYLYFLDGQGSYSFLNGILFQNDSWNYTAWGAFYQNLLTSLIPDSFSKYNIADSLISGINFNSELVDFCLLYNTYFLYFILGGFILLFAMLGSISLCIEE